jgi:hypothetical protein
LTMSARNRCLNRFKVDEHEVPVLKIEHHDLDAWKPEWFRIVFEDLVIVQCDDGQWIDNNEQRNITTCYRIGGDKHLPKN